MNPISNDTFGEIGHFSSKYRMSRIYCSHAKVWEEFIQRGKSKPFGENDNRDDKKIYLS